MPANLTSFDAILKESYVINSITDQLNENTDAWKDFESLTLNWTGKRCVIPLRISRNSGTGAVAENGTLPAAGQQGYEDMIVTARGVYGSAQLTGFALASSVNSQGVFNPTGLQAEMNGLVEDVRKLMSALLFFGNSVIGFVWQKQNAAAPLGATFQYSGRLDNTEDTFAGVAVGVGRSGTLVRLDDYTVVPGSTQQINSITTVAGEPTIVFNAAINTAVVPTEVPMAVVYDTAVATDKDPAIEPKGFTANLAAVNHFGLDRSLAANAQIRSNFRLADTAAAAYSPLTAHGLDSLIATSNKRSGKRFDKFWLAIEQLVAYSSLLQGVAVSNLRVDVKDDSKSADAGFTNLHHQGIPFRTSDVCPIGTIWGVHNAGYKKAVLSSGQWLDYNGVLRQVPGIDAGIAQWRMLYDVACIQPNAQGVLTAVEVPT
ncbi:MAG: phage major capsid protein [Deltaproteobacteria bacterium]|nr:phage major capsid protein [Deltaproteobacteria bacterium]